MSYKTWFDAHANKHKKIVDKLVISNYTKDEIIEYFVYENMVKSEKDFCPLYVDGKKCHEIDKLNCYLCACPNFRFSDDGIKNIDDKTQYSFCDIDSKDGKLGTYGDAMHQDCSKCIVPHHKSYIEKHFDYEWKKVMNKCKVG